MKITDYDFIEQGEMVVVRSKLTGTQVCDFAVIPAKAKPINIMALDIHLFENGMVVRSWHVEDWMRGMDHMGAIDK